MNNVCIAVNICTYKRKKYISQTLEKLKSSLFFDKERKTAYLGSLYVYIVDNACEIEEIDSEHIQLRHNPRGNVGGSGGYQYGIELIRASQAEFTHVVFMDDDVEFDISCFYKLFDFLQKVDEQNVDRPVAGRMFRMDKRDIQYTAGEIWNMGNIEHVGFQKPLCEVEREPEVNLKAGAEYGGWWFCCFPYEFVKKNDIMPFFIHCDDVEYGLRCGRPPVIVKGVQVWHETFEYRQTPIMCYYDTRNPLFVNEKYQLYDQVANVLGDWKNKILYYHLQQQWNYAYFAIKGMIDFLRGINWLERIQPGKYHNKLQRASISRYKNSVMWRIAEYKFKKKYRLRG